VHLFVFYFGLMADVTPPVGLASFAASAISGASPVGTGVQAFRYEIRTALLPFIFIFNNELLLIDIGGPFHLALVVGSSLIAMLLFVSATQGHFLVRSRWYESAALLLVCFTLFRRSSRPIPSASWNWRRTSPRAASSVSSSAAKRAPGAR
jgi:TRAP-type uncharacterized transport system fused permease subunit